MKTVLFCGGLGTRIRDYSENVPKPMVPIGDKPILWHLMQYYSEYGHRDFVLCLGYKANVIKEFFLNYRPHVYTDCVVSGFGDNIETLGDPQQDWRITMIDTGLWRNIGERLLAVRQHLEREEMFLANYSDGLTDVGLPAMIDTFRQSQKIACFLAVRPSFSLHLVEMDESGPQQELEPIVERAVIRIVGEALRNVAQHAGAQKAKVSLQYGPEGVVVTIEDDGRGFDVEHTFTSAEGRGHFGVIGMRERAEAAGGQLVVRSEAGHGTIVRASIPYSNMATVPGLAGPIEDVEQQAGVDDQATSDRGGFLGRLFGR